MNDERRAFGRVALVAAIGAAIVLWLALSPLLAAPSSTRAPGSARRPAVGARRGERQRTPLAMVDQAGVTPSARTGPGTPEARRRRRPRGQAVRRALGRPGTSAGSTRPRRVSHRRASRSPIERDAVDEGRARSAARSASCEARYPRSVGRDPVRRTARCGPARRASPTSPRAARSLPTRRSRSVASPRRSPRRSSSRSPARAGSTSTRRCGPTCRSSRSIARITVRQLLDHTSGLQ